MAGPAKIRPNELRSKNKTEMLKMLDDLRREMVDLRVNKISNGSAGKLSRISVVRKSIARILTLMNQKARQNLREYYKGKTHKPLDLRPKQTRAIRRRLSRREKSAKTVRQHKRDIHFPIARSFAVRA